MRAYKNDNGMVDIFHNEPDETITVEEFEARKAESERQMKIEEHLAALRELGVTLSLADGHEPEETKVELEETTPTTGSVAAEVPSESSAEVFKTRRW